MKTRRLTTCEAFVVNGYGYPVVPESNSFRYAISDGVAGCIRDSYNNGTLPKELDFLFDHNDFNEKCHDQLQALVQKDFDRRSANQECPIRETCVSAGLVCGGCDYGVFNKITWRPHKPIKVIVDKDARIGTFTMFDLGADLDLELQERLEEENRSCEDGADAEQWLRSMGLEPHMASAVASYINDDSLEMPNLRNKMGHFLLTCNRHELTRAEQIAAKEAQREADEAKSMLADLEKLSSKSDEHARALSESIGKLQMLIDENWGTNE